jgi:hypothetical protein
VSAWGRLPDEITLTRNEAASILLALDAAGERVEPGDVLYGVLGAAAGIIVTKCLPDLPDL